MIDIVELGEFLTYTISGLLNWLGFQGNEMVFWPLIIEIEGKAEANRKQ